MQKLIQIKATPQEKSNTKELQRKISKESKIEEKYLSYRIMKESLDCRREPVYHLEVMVSSNNDLPKREPMPFLDVNNSAEIIIVGAGPCGLMAALRLIQKGLKPIIIERGKEVSERKKDVAGICQNKSINEDSNYCFGEGGAGTFSDGKLFTRSTKKGNIDEVLQMLVYFGAKEEIMYQTHAHIGTDCLSRIVKNIREQIIKCGGEYLFNTKVEDFIVKDNTVLGIITDSGEEIRAEKTILATGHSARDIYQLFYDKGWQIEAKPFAMGVRIEHSQEWINQTQYHNSNYSELLPPATYSLTFNNKDRGIYSFCMCPGGIIVPSSDRNNAMVVNGMSNSKRSGGFGNSAIVVSVKEEDARKYTSYGALSLLKLQEQAEKMMYYKNQISPAQRVTDFVNNKTSQTLAPTSYMPGLVSMNMKERLFPFIYDNLVLGLKDFDRKMKGFITEKANIIGLESRTSSAVRITRNPTTLQHIQLNNLYPAGEGAGYCGGITSSALDGINVANKIANELGV
jgi:uncharacterized FAD-dependent dehydrogenase